MDVKGKITGLSQDYRSRKVTFSFEVSEGSVARLEELQDKELKCTLVQWRKHRSKDANALLWACFGKMAATLGGDKEDYYLQALRKYGKFTMLSVKPEAYDYFKQTWRTCEIVGERNGMYDVLCYFGSSTYNTKEFAVLLDGVIEDMKAAGIDTPLQEDLQHALDAWEGRKNEQSKTQVSQDD